MTPLTPRPDPADPAEPATDPAEPDRLLAAYDAELRTDAETPSALAVARRGPLRLITFPGGRGFVTYPHLRVGDGVAAGWVEEVLAHYRADPAITRVEWKTRGHDVVPGLDEALRAGGFAPEERESVMVGGAARLDVEVSLPAGVTLRQVSEEADVRAMSAMADRAFGDPVSRRRADDVLHRLALADGMQLWVAEAGGEMVGAGRLEPVAGSSFAGIWGGATLVGWRGRGIYRGLTAARARSALALGKTLIHSDSTEDSRPILERLGMARVSTTTPYVWVR